ncbi:MAG: hypothetical protein MUC33_20385, partial [Desulfobacterales bacterium]|nr:hypothetical protein [Desulfobacterales bacterium]
AQHQRPPGIAEGDAFQVDDRCGAHGRIMLPLPGVCKRESLNGDRRCDVPSARALSVRRFFLYCGSGFQPRFFFPENFAIREFIIAAGSRSQ